MKEIKIINNARLIESANYGNLDAVIGLILKGANVDFADGDGRTALHWACCKGHVDIAIELISRKANVCAIDNYGQTPLHFAVNHLYKGLIDLLISNGADVNARDGSGFYPIHNAARNTNNIESGNCKNIGKLISFGANIDVQNNYGETPLHSSTSNQNKLGSLFLIKKGANINIKDKDGDTPIRWAISDKSTDVLIELASRSMHAKGLKSNDKSYLEDAESFRKEESALVLIAYGAAADGLNGYFSCLRDTTAHQAAAQMGLTSRMVQLLEEQPSSLPSDAPEALVLLAKENGRTETAAAIQSHMARMAIEKLLTKSCLRK